MYELSSLLSSSLEDYPELLDSVNEALLDPSYTSLTELNGILHDTLPIHRSAPLINHVINFMEDSSFKYMVGSDIDGRRIIKEYGTTFLLNPLNNNTVKHISFRQIYTMMANRIYYGLVHPKLYETIRNVLKQVYGLELPIAYNKAAFMNIPFEIIKHSKAEEIKLCIANITIEFLKTYDEDL